MIDLRRPSSRRFVAVISFASAIALAGPAVGSAVAAEVSLDVSKKEIVFGKKTKLSGTLSGVTMGGNSSREITLTKSQWPYDTETVVTTTTTNQSGDFSFGKIEPDLNTRYVANFEGTVLEGSAESADKQVYVFPRTSFDLDVVGSGTAKAEFGFIYSPMVQPEYPVGRRDLNWYFRKVTQNRFKRIDRTKFTDTASGVAGKLSYRLPRGNYRFIVTVCVDAPDRDIGFGNDKPFKCPKSFKAGRNRAAERSFAP